jgi:phosphoribosyl-dephospho-CoA transferase
MAKITINPSPKPNSQPGEDLQSLCVIQLTRSPGSSRNLLESNHIDAGFCLRDQNTFQLGWSTAQIEHVALHTGNEVFIVVQRPSDLSLHLFTIEPRITLHEEVHLKVRHMVKLTFQD